MKREPGCTSAAGHRVPHLPLMPSLGRQPPSGKRAGRRSSTGETQYLEPSKPSCEPGARVLVLGFAKCRSCSRLPLDVARSLARPSAAFPLPVGNRRRVHGVVSHCLRHRAERGAAHGARLTRAGGSPLVRARDHRSSALGIREIDTHDTTHLRESTEDVARWKQNAERSGLRTAMPLQCTRSRGPAMFCYEQDGGVRPFRKDWIPASLSFDRVLVGLLVGEEQATRSANTWTWSRGRRTGATVRARRRDSMTRPASETLHPILQNVRRRGIVPAIAPQSDFRRTRDTAGVTGANTHERLLECCCERRSFASGGDRHRSLVGSFFDSEDHTPRTCVVGVNQSSDAPDDARPTLGRHRGRSCGIVFLEGRRLRGSRVTGVACVAKQLRPVRDIWFSPTAFIPVHELSSQPQ